MHIRQNRVKQKGKTYEYVQLVESYRNKKGTPCKRVVADISHLTPTQINNLRVALKAARLGSGVIIKPETAAGLGASVDLSLDYLDVAVVQELWEQSGLGSICSDLLSADDLIVQPAKVVAALVGQRIVAPDSKLAAARWLPRTALPELLNLSTGTFNNSRIHRTLSAIEPVDQKLQDRVSQARAQRGVFAALYMDSTDTFFVGRGPEMATFGKTKEGRNERKIGILLLCNERGEPLRWKIVEGRSADNLIFRDLFGEIQDVNWAQDVPIVVDRAMGSTADINAMKDTGLRFLTALRANEFDSYTDRIPRKSIGSLTLELSGEPEAEKADSRLLAETVSKVGFERVDNDLFVMELGVKEAGKTGKAELDYRLTETRSSDNSSLNQEALQQGLQIRKQFEEGVFRNHDEAAQSYGYGRTWLWRRMNLARLPQSIQQDIARGGTDHVPIKGLAEIYALPPEEQQTTYDKLKMSQTRSSGKRKRSRKPLQTKVPLEVREVLYFRPSLHLKKRRSLNERIGIAHGFVRSLNDDIREGRTRLSGERQVARVEEMLTKRSLRLAFEVNLADDGTVLLKEKPAYLEHQRGRFGFNLLIAHPNLTETAQQLVELYRSKNEVERDFRTIKSVFELRPVYHRTDAKVAAHVTICMLALLLTRILEAKLKGTGFSPEAALEIFSTCKLNRLTVGDEQFHTVTKPTGDQLNLLKAIDMTHLTDDRVVVEMIEPR